MSGSEFTAGRVDTFYLTPLFPFRRIQARENFPPPRHFFSLAAKVEPEAQPRNPLSPKRKRGTL
jgi:hypothetical protein